MSEYEEDQARESENRPLREGDDDMTVEQRRRQTESPGPGHPAEGASDPGGHPSPTEGTPVIGDEDQQLGQTSHPAPDDDVGVGDQGTGE